MHLYLSTRSPLSSAFTDENGQVIYKVKTTPGGWIANLDHKLCRTQRYYSTEGRTPRPTGTNGSPICASRANLSTTSLHPPFCTLVETRLRQSSFSARTGWGVYGRHRVFTGSDGREHKWPLQMFYSKTHR